MNEKSKKISFSKFKGVLRTIKTFLWMAVIGLGFTLVQTTGLIFATDEVYLDVSIADQEKTNTHTISNGELFLNQGSFKFQSTNFLDKVFFKHINGYYHFLPSLFNFSICILLLLIIRKIEINSPYSFQIANRIQWIGYIYIGFGILSILVSLYTHFKMIEFSNKLIPQFSTLSSDMGGILIGIFILIIAFIYRVGVYYQEDSNSTI